MQRELFTFKNTTTKVQRLREFLLSNESRYYTDKDAAALFKCTASNIHATRKKLNVECWTKSELAAECRRLYALCNKLKAQLEQSNTPKTK